MIFRPLLLLALLAAPWATASAACPPAPTPALRLPLAKAAMERDKRLIIVALGSSSTEGAGASQASHAYPARLAVLLSAALPGITVRVENAGIGGQDATDMMARMQADVIAARPALVIWQVGANGALRGVEPRLFQALISAGIFWLRAEGLDVVMMDNQRAPRIQSRPGWAAIEAALAAAATQGGASLFPRGALMDAWAQSGASPATFLTGDGLHHNDHGYECLAKALAASILTALERGKHP